MLPEPMTAALALPVISVVRWAEALMDDTVHYLGRSSIGLSSPIRPTVFQDATHEEVHTALTLETLAGTYGGALPTPESPVGDLDRRKRQELARIHGVWGGVGSPNRHRSIEAGSTSPSRSEGKDSSDGTK